MLYSFSTDISFFLPELFFLITLMILLLWALDINARFAILNALLVERLIYLLIEVHVLTILLLSNNFHKTRILFYESIVNNNYTVVIKMLVLACTIIFLTMIVEQVKQYFSDKFEFLILIALSTFSLLLLTAAHDLITFYLSIEMQSLCLYVLAAFKRTSKLSTEAGLKYFILGTLSSSLLLFGMSMIYGFIGSTNFDDIMKSILNIETIDQVPLSFSLGLILLLCGLLFKLTAVPFHIWSPDVYEGAPLLVMIFFSTIPKLAIFCFFTKLIYSIFFDLYFIWQPLLVITAILTISFSSIATLYQKKIKRFLVYSSINHVGYMLMSLSTGTLVGINAFFFYLIIYLITMFTFFCILLSFKKETNKNIIYITDLLYTKDVSYTTQFMIILLFFSMAGIPPLIGFFSKFYVFFAAIESSQYLLLTLSILCSTLSAFYYIRVIKIISFEKSQTQNVLKFRPTGLVSFYILMGLLFTTLLFVVPNFLITETYSIGLLLQ